MKKILLVYPEIPPTYWSFKYALPFVGKKASIPPLGLLTVAAMLPSHYKVELIDINFMPLSDEVIASADLVFISAMIVQKDSLNKLIERCKCLGKSVVAGGPYPTSSYKSIENVDYFVLNEAEITLPQFLEDWENNKAKHVYSSSVKADITTTPIPRFDLIPMHSYGSMALQYSRGCPFNCEFCDIIEMFGRRPRVKNNEQVIRELDTIYSLGWRGAVFIVDDNFIGNKRKVKELLPIVADWQKERKYPFELFTETSINLAADEYLLDLMSVAGFNMVFLGIETPVDETLASTGKTQNLRQDLFNSVIKIQSKGIEVTGGFIVGFDNDPPDIFERQIKFIQKSGIVLAMVGLLTALPNTQLYRRLEKEGRLVQDSSGNNTHDLQLNFKPKMDLNTLISGYKYILTNIYNPKAYFERCLTFLNNLHPHQHSSRQVRFAEVLALVKSLLRQTFTKYGHYYLEFVIKSFITEPRMFPEAIRQAIIGHHFFKITQEIIAVDNFKNRAKSIKSVYKEKVREAHLSLEKLKEVYNSFDVEEKIKDLRNIKDKFIKELQEEYHKIDKDFRHLVEDSLQTIEKTLDSMYNQWLEGSAF
ncbi:MAG: DUF4070 domain-containing protein [bacterium]